jgi:glycosyltransferase involved in cell wall biosynthesis
MSAISEEHATPPATVLRPRISVVVPAVNEELYLGACLESLRRQDLDPDLFEVVVVDNNSTDATADVARSWGVTVVSEPRPGVCWARDAGSRRSRGEIVVSTDADTTFDPGWLSRIDRRFRERPELVAVVGPCRFVEAPWWGRVYTGVVFGAVNLVQRLTGRVLYASATNIAFRRDAWAGYDTHLTQGGDELGLLRQLRAHGAIGFDAGNPTFTSSRRLTRGLLYNLFVTCFYYYLVGYLVNRVSGRRLLGTAPEIRVAGTVPVLPSRAARLRRTAGWWAAALVMSVVMLRIGPDLA